MQVFRIDRQKRADSLLTGKGAELYGGRWNTRGTPVVYCASSRSLAILEVLVHLDWQKHLPQDRIMATIEIPDELVYKPDPDSFGTYWAGSPYHSDSQRVFAEFLQQEIHGDSVAIAVPSAVVPEELNICLDPTSQWMRQVKIVESKPWRLDERLVH